MDSVNSTAVLGAQGQPLPALRLDAAGRRHVDLRVFAHLAWPLIFNNGLQAVLNLTDTFFIALVSPTATAAVGVIYWLILACVLVVGGVAMCVQTFVAQEVGSGRRWRAGRSAWAGVWASALTTPFFVGLAFLGPWILSPFGLSPEVVGLADAYWMPRMLGEPIGIALWAALGFYNGIGRTRLTLGVTLTVAIANALLNPLFMFTFGMGVGGAAWATNAAQLVGLVMALAVMLGPQIRHDYKTHITWRPNLRWVTRHFTLGIPMGFVAGADLIGLSIFQLIVTKLGIVPGAATQVVFMLTSIAYMPGVGLALAGTTLVGQAIGAGDRDWANKLGNTAIAIAAGYMGAMGLLIAACGPWLMPLFVNTAEPTAPAVIALGVQVLWLAAIYQAFDGLNLGAAFCLRGAGDARVPAVMVAVLSWLVWVPLTHMLTFAPGEGFVDFLPQYGYGAVGAWWAATLYVTALGLMLYARWWSGAWRKIRL